MGIGLIESDTPEIFKDKDGHDLPVESLTGTDKTAYLKIDLKVKPMGGQPVAPMTAVFAPDPKKLSGAVDVLLWLHGDKNYWNKTGTESFSFRGRSIQSYLTFSLCKLREFILQSTKRKFLLVAPTLNDRTGINIGHGDYNPGGLRWNQADAAAYLQQVLNGVKKHMGANVTSLGNIVLAAHSGGGHIQGQMAQSFSGKFDKMNEVWCFDSTYWGSKPFINWYQKGHSNSRLWVYSTGGTTGVNASDIMKLTQPSPAPRPFHPQTRVTQLGAFINRGIQKVDTVVRTIAAKTRNIDVLIEKDPHNGKPSSTDFFLAAYGGMAGGHYEGMKQYLPTLVERSRNLN